MPFEVFADEAFVRELAKSTREVQVAIRAALEGLRDHPIEHPKVARLHGTRYAGSFRMRIGSHRVLGLILASQNLVFLTTLFDKRHASDYTQALERHERRLLALGPPLGDAIQAVRKKKRIA